MARQRLAMSGDVDYWRPNKSARATWCLVGLGLMAGMLAISHQSYWIDEAVSVDKALQPTISAWWSRLLEDGTSEMQLPLYLLYAWGWEKVFGAGEWAMRAANLPWFVLAVAGLNWSFAGLRERSALATLSGLCNAFLWTYVDEVRPYIMQLGASSLVFAALIHLSVQPRPGSAEERRWVRAMVGGALVLAFSSPLGMLWLGCGLGTACLVNWGPRLRQMGRDHLGSWGLMALCFSGIGIYYLWMLRAGARANVYEPGSDLRNVLFIVYELLGFSGLGPGRTAIRTEGLAAFGPYVPWLAIYAALLTVVGLAGWKRLRSRCSGGTVLRIAICLTAMVTVLILVGAAHRFRLLGRHSAPLWPVAVFPVGLGLVALWERPRWPGRLCVVAFVALGLLSSLEGRFSARHAKDDYRGAAAQATSALQRGEVVWWNAVGQGARVYGVPLADRPGEPGKALYLRPRLEGFEAGLARPDLVVTSKPDLFDPNGLVAQYLARSGYRPTGRLPAFTLWRRD